MLSTCIALHTTHVLDWACSMHCHQPHIRIHTLVMHIRSALVCAQAVWKMFCTMPFFMLCAATSSAASSLRLSRQPRAPRFSCACDKSFAPGMGTVPLQMHQLMDTCGGHSRTQRQSEGCWIYQTYAECTKQPSGVVSTSVLGDPPSSTMLSTANASAHPCIIPMKPPLHNESNYDE